MHGDQMEETSKPPTRKKSGWSTDPHDRTGAEVWRQMYELTVDRRSECNEHESCQALSRAALSIVAQQAQSCHLAFKFFVFLFKSVHAFPQRSLISVSAFYFWPHKE